MNARRFLTHLGLILAAAPAALVAQTATTSALTGVVRDPSGAPLAGAVVRISSPSLIGGERTATTATNGVYRIPALPPGVYRIVVEAKNFPTQAGTETLELGRTATVNWRMASSAGTVVEVVAATANVDANPVGVSQNYDLDSLKALPAGRDISAYLALTPGVNAERAWGGDRNSNAYMMDGINVGDPSGNWQWIYPNMDWIQEMQVGGIGAPAEFGGFTGAFVNAIIKSGGNTTEGNLSGYYSRNSWRAKSSNDDPRVTDEDKVIPPGEAWDVSFNLGGPIVKDKIWYFVSAERIGEKESPIGAPVPLTTKTIKLLGKVTWQVIPTATLSAFAEYDTLDYEHKLIDRWTMPEASVKQTSPSRSFNLTWTQTFGSDLVLTLKGQGYSGRFDYESYNGEANPLDAYDLYNGIEYYNNTSFLDKNYRARNAFSGTLDWFKTGFFAPGDSHAFKFGFEQEASSDDSSERYPGGALFYAFTDFGNPDDPQDDQLLTDTAVLGGGYDYKARMNRTAAFVQDTWTLNPWVTIRAGLRYEKFQGKGAGGDTLWDSTTLAPRIGATFALVPDQSQLLKVHWGRYFEGMSSWFFERAIPGAYPNEYEYLWGSETPINPLNPATWPAVDTTVDPLKVTEKHNRVDPDAKHPYVDETTLSYEIKFNKLWSASATYIRRDMKDPLARREESVDTGGYTSGIYNPLTGQLIPLFETSLGGNDHRYLITNESRAKRTYQAASLNVDRKLADNWSMVASYTWAENKGNSTMANGYNDAFINPNNQINFQGLLPGFHKHEVKARGTYLTPWNMTVALTYAYLSGTRWTPTLSTFRIGEDSTRFTIFAAERGSQKFPSRSLLDIRVTQRFNLTKKMNLEVFAEIFNLMNNGAATNWSTRVNASRYDYVPTIPGELVEANEIHPDYKLPSATVDPRRLKVGVRFNF